jgi:hypothetical protein
MEAETQMKRQISLGAEETDECAIENDIPFIRSVTAPAPTNPLGVNEVFAVASRI